ncbi:NAD-dependent epimerase/dehydratase family protein [Marilutibacter aestuarii]|uniref:NAD-dependent epimerase/dehydratase family protein n=1 Tax=Marilutibacter aestuarii TaxID=1706195 RepID=A0A508AP14_9GAMM|nr:NAD-dependent epimerase/dehydratase family protein [Lysobacter aestuarii]TQD48885.1 NAD-dependent epimerase/dehydratase family protein [Lysobacter aestuarii]
MQTGRRELLLGALAGAVAMALPACAAGGSVAGAPPKARPLRILVMGGTGFLGPHFVEAALAQGHRLTLFNRGKSHPERFSDPRYAAIEQLQGDRKTDLSALEGEQRWDAVLDTSAYIPADVTRSARLLAPRIGQYLLVSTISVYARNDIVDMDEDAELIRLPDPTVTEVTGETYGGLKALCEAAARAEMPEGTTVVRPGLIVGPGDTTDRFTYWPARADRGGEILGPGSPEAPTQFIDARDLADFLLHLLETRTLGTFNADAPAGALTMGAVLDASREAARSMSVRHCVTAPCPQPPGAQSSVTWVPADFLEAQGVRAWQDMPAWIPARGEYAGFGRTRTTRAQAAGLRYRPLEETVRDTLEWWRAQPESRRAQPRAGLAPEREAEVLRAWHAARQTG